MKWNHLRPLYPVSSFQKLWSNQRVCLPLSIYGSSTLHPDLGKNIQKLVRGSSPPLNLLPKASRQWWDRVCLRALYFIPNAIQAALSNVIRGPGGLVTIPSFFNSYEPCLVADALSQDPGVDMKTRLDAECVAAITCARLDPSDQRTPPILVDRLDMPGDEVVQYLQTRERDNLLLAYLLSFVRRICRTGLGVRHIIEPNLTARTLWEGTDRRLDELRISEPPTVFSPNMGHS